MCKYNQNQEIIKISLSFIIGNFQILLHFVSVKCIIIILLLVLVLSVSVLSVNAPESVWLKKQAACFV